MKTVTHKDQGEDTGWERDISVFTILYCFAICTLGTYGRGHPAHQGAVNSLCQGALLPLCSFLLHVKFACHVAKV